MPRGTNPGELRIQFLTSAASPAALTVALLTAGVDLVGDTDNSEGYAMHTGFEKKATTIPTPDMRSHEVGNVPGDVTFPDSSMTFYYDDAETAIYTALTEGTAGWIAFCHEGITATEKYDLWPVEVISVHRPLARDDAKKFVVTFSLGTPIIGTVAA